MSVEAIFCILAVLAGLMSIAVFFSTVKMVITDEEMKGEPLFVKLIAPFMAMLVPVGIVLLFVYINTIGPIIAVAVIVIWAIFAAIKMAFKK